MNLKRDTVYQSIYSHLQCKWDGVNSWVRCDSESSWSIAPVLSYSLMFCYLNDGELVEVEQWICEINTAII